jgi:hypothetical protein
VARREERVLRPQPHTRYRIVAKNRQVLADWEAQLRTRLDACIRLWDHLATSPTEPIGGRYGPLHGPQAWCEHDGQRLRQWQWEIDRRARLKVGIGGDVVVIMSVSSGHPKENE